MSKGVKINAKSLQNQRKIAVESTKNHLFVDDEAQEVNEKNFKIHQRCKISELQKLHFDDIVAVDEKEG